MQELPITLIKPRGRFTRLDLKDIWASRELLYFLTLRDVQVRYKQTAIGIAWAVLQPVLTTAIFALLFSAVAKFNTASIPYPLFALSGLVVWLYLHNAITKASNSFVNNVNLVTKVYFPRLIMPLSGVLSGLVDLAISLAILLILMLYYSAPLSMQIFMAPLFLALGVFTAVVFGTLFSALNVRFRDVQVALPFLLQIWMIASPIFYPTDLLSEKWRLAYALNPLTGILEGFRSSLFGTLFDWKIIGISCAVLGVSAILSLIVFKKMEDDFADLI